MTRREEGEAIVGMLGRGLAAELEDTTTGPPMGFCLLVFDFGDSPDKFVAYCSNARRENIIQVLREQIARLESGCN